MGQFAKEVTRVSQEVGTEGYVLPTHSRNLDPGHSLTLTPLLSFSSYACYCKSYSRPRVVDYRIYVVGVLWAVMTCGKYPLCGFFSIRFVPLSPGMDRVFCVSMGDGRFIPYVRCVVIWGLRSGSLTTPRIPTSRSQTLSTSLHPPHDDLLTYRHSPPIPSSPSTVNSVARLSFSMSKVPGAN